MCITDTGSLRARGTVSVNERLRKTKKEEEEKEEEEVEASCRPCGADDLETKAILSSPPAAQTNTIIDKE